MKKIILIFAFTQLVSCNNESSDENIFPLNEETIEIYLLNNLNDERGYCIDMMGYKNNATGKMLATCNHPHHVKVLSL